MAYLTLSTVLCFVGLQCPWIIIQFGWFVGWIYLRFYKKNPAESVGGTDTYGDRSETFSLISWFPPFMQWAAHYLWKSNESGLTSKLVTHWHCWETLFIRWQTVSILYPRLLLMLNLAHTVKYQVPRVQRRKDGGSIFIIVWNRRNTTNKLTIYQSHGFESFGSKASK